MIDTAQLARLMVQTETLHVLRPDHDPDDLLKLARAIYCAGLEEAAGFAHEHAITHGEFIAGEIRKMKGKK